MGRRRAQDEALLMAREPIGPRAREREWRVAEALARSALDLQGVNSLLFLHDDQGHAASLVGERVDRFASWSRHSRGARRGQLWPEGGPYDGALLRLPRAKPALDLALHAAAAVLSPGASLWVYGANDEGIRSIGKRVAALFDEVETVDTRGHCRLWHGRRRDGDPERADLEAWAQSISLEFDGQTRPWTGFPGVFGSDGIDAGTQFLLQTLPTPPAGARVLDFGAGAGAIAAALAMRGDSLELHLLETDAIALEAARRNVGGATLWLGEGWDAGVGGDFDWIVSNPPLHLGRDEDHTVLEALVASAPAHLREDGELWLVVQSRIDVGEVLRRDFATVEVAAANRRFRVWRAQ